MEAWFLLLVPIIPPSVLAARRPHTEKWRRARKLFWKTTAIAAVTTATTVTVIILRGPAAFFLGPAVIWLAALLVNMIVFAIWAYAAGTIRTERNVWREQHKGKESNVGAPGIDPAKPWKA